MRTFLKDKGFKYTALIAACIFICTSSSANTIKDCDSLIRKGIDAMWKKEYVKSIGMLTEARTLAEKNGWHEQHFLATNNIGANYYNMLDYGEALKYYLEGYTIAVKELEPKHEMVVLNNIAILYSKQKEYDKAKEYLVKAYNIARKNNDSVKIGLYSLNLGHLANETGNLKSARRYITESFPFIKKDRQMLLLAQIGLAENDLLLGNIRQAREKAQELYKTAPNLNFNEVGTSLMLIITESYLKEKNYNGAIESAHDLLAATPNAETKKALFELLSKAYAGSGNYNEALKAKDSVISAIEELDNIKNQALLTNSQVKFEVQDYKNRLAINEEKLASERTLFYSIGAVILAAVTILILIFRNRAIKHKQKKAIAERNQQIIALELEKEKNGNLLLEQQIKEKETQALLEQERLKNEIEARNRKLSAKALYLSGRDQLIEEIIDGLSANAEVSKNTALQNHIKTLKDHLKSNDEWDSFITHFEEVNQGFLNKLKALHPSLNANDIRFISYTYMNLSTKEIATMLNITLEACRKRKERIAAKLELPDNVQLYDYLSAI